jgi:hypothetical protein
MTINGQKSKQESQEAMPMQYSEDKQAAWRVVQKHCPAKTEAQCRAMIQEWIKAGVLIERTYHNPVTV